MKRKLIEIHQEHLIVCDNKQCNYKIKNPIGGPNEDISMFLNKPCPNCGDNLLTEKDYNDAISFLKIINWINKWFSWLTVFKLKNKSTQKTTLKIHKGFKIQSESTNN